MSIVFSKASKPPDNITYLMQSNDKGTKEKTDKEMQDIADEQTRQFGILGTKTQVKVWPKNKPFDPQYMDETDNVTVLGDRPSQESFAKKYFPKDDAAIGWGNSTNVGVSAMAKPHSSNLQDITTPYSLNPGRYSFVDYNAAMQSAKSAPQNKITSVLAFLLNHEATHNFLPTSNQGAGSLADAGGHIGSGLMGDGQITTMRLRGMGQPNPETIDEILLNTSGSANQYIRDYMIATRQHGQNNLLPTDNYDANKKRHDEEKLNGSIETQSINNTYLPDYIPIRKTILNSKLINRPYYDLQPSINYNQIVSKKFGGVLINKIYNKK